MRKTDIEIRVNHIIESIEIVVNAEKRRAEICVSQKEYQRNSKKQKERKWVRYINQLETDSTLIAINKF